MKLSVSLADADVAFMDEYARAQGVPSRSAVIQRAVALLRAAELGAAYADAWQEWYDTPDADEWDATSGDGLSSDR